MDKKKDWKCDYCSKRIEGIHIWTENVERGGGSFIYLGSPNKFWKENTRHEVGEEHYCNAGCLFADIKKSLSYMRVRNV